jgi:hypothetical protein
MYRHHFESRARVNAKPAELDDQERLSAHMMKSSMMMAGSTMRFEFDAATGRQVGLRMRMFGRAMGLSLDVTEAVTRREPSRLKVWETLGEPRLLVVGRYQMGFVIEPEADKSRLTVFIDYDLPLWPWRWAGLLLGGFYARWCTRRMAEDAAATFKRSDATAATVGAEDESRCL